MRKEKHSSDPQKEKNEDIYVKKFRKNQRIFEVLKKKYELEKKENLRIKRNPPLNSLKKEKKWDDNYKIQGTQVNLVKTSKEDEDENSRFWSVKQKYINTKSSQTKGQESEIVEKDDSIEERLARIRKETEDLRKGLAAVAGFRQHGKTPDEDYSNESIYICMCGKKFASPELFIDHVCEEEE